MEINKTRQFRKTPVRMRTNRLVLVYMRALIVLRKKIARSKLAGHRIDLSGVEAGGHGILMKMLGKVKVRGLDEVDQKKNGRHAGLARPCGMLAGHGTDWETRTEENTAARLNRNGESRLADGCRPCAE